MTNEGRKPTTTDAGIPVPSDEYSLTVGPNGPILLQDHYLIEQMANFNRERIPERQPHAKGGGAFGQFAVTRDVSQYTKAAVFQMGVKTDMLARFSTVAGERGSPDTWRAVQPRALIRKVMDGAQRDRLISNLVGHLKDRVSEPVLERAFEYWRSVDKEIGDRVAKGVRGESRQRASALG